MTAIHAMLYSFAVLFGFLLGLLYVRVRVMQIRARANPKIRGQKMNRAALPDYQREKMNKAFPL